jgi:hypothetical protein
MIMTQFNEQMIMRNEIHGQQHVITYSLEKGIQHFGDKGRTATNKEMTQMLDRICFKPIHKSELSAMECKRAIELLIFLSEKKDGTVKAHHCANGNTQRNYTERDAVYSPAVSMESTLLKAVIEAKEEQERATCNIPNVFIQTEHAQADSKGNQTIMKIRGLLVQILFQLNPTYNKYIVTENNKQVLNVHVQRAIYGLMMLKFFTKS